MMAAFGAYFLLKFESSSRGVLPIRSVSFFAIFDMASMFSWLFSCGTKIMPCSAVRQSHEYGIFTRYGLDMLFHVQFELLAQFGQQWIFVREVA